MFKMLAIHKFTSIKAFTGKRVHVLQANLHLKKHQRRRKGSSGGARFSSALVSHIDYQKRQSKKCKNSNVLYYVIAIYKQLNYYTDAPGFDKEDSKKSINVISLRTIQEVALQLFTFLTRATKK